MSDYTQSTDFSSKDSLSTGDPNKLLLGSEVDAELAAIATAIATKFDTSNDGAGSGLDADSVDGVGPVAVGTYTPTLTNTLNIDSSTARLNLYIRIGTNVFVFGAVTVNGTTPSSPVDLGISLPIASNIGTEYDLSGLGNGNTNDGCTIRGDASNNRALLEFSAGAGDENIRYAFGYRII